MIKSSYLDYALPEDLIAAYPANPRESSRLLVYHRETRTIVHDRFYNLQKHLPENLSVILNDTKVIKARLFGQKESGGKVELLYERQGGEGFIFQIRGRVKEGVKIKLSETVSAEVVRLLEDGFRELKLFDADRLLGMDEVLEIFEKLGHIPLPPYIKREDEQQDELTYQSVFAKDPGSVAAPTASLHFSEAMLEDFKKRYNVAYVTLHVGSGTFKPLSSDDIYVHKMHAEIYEIGDEAKAVIEGDSKLLCIGSTVLRSVETYTRNGIRKGETSIYLTPKNPPLRADYLLTNFHLPKTSLLVMVASLIGEAEVLRVYEEAIKERYRFFSYGDAMLIL